MNDEAQRVLDTLFHPLQSGAAAPPGGDARAGFFNAQLHPALSLFKPERLFLQQYFRPHAQQLEAAGYTVHSDTDAGPETGNLDMALLALPKNRIEAEYMIASALRALKPGGILFAAADNKAGGARLEKMLAAFGLEDIQTDSRNKCRVVRGKRGGGNETAIEHALAAGSPQPILNGRFQSWPGIFGWDKIDRGSEILLQHLPPGLKGRGADFGCGYGYLSARILQQPTVTELWCIDADIRALRMCEENLSKFKSGMKIHYLWEDLRRPVPSCRALDFIVMNPPFHEGKAADEDIGAAFIATAAASLKPGGALYMVANRQLAYEQVLQDLFARTDKVFEGQGFKVFHAIKA